MDSVEEKLLRNLSPSDLRELLAVLRKVALRREKFESQKAQGPLDHPSERGVSFASACQDAVEG